MPLIKFFTVLFFAGFLLGACVANETGGPASPMPPASPLPSAAPEAPSPPDELALGESKYTEYCSKCHREDGSGGAIEIEGKMLTPANLVSEKMKKHPDEEFIEHITEGIPDEGMPSFKGELSEDEIKAVVRYIREKLQKQ